MAEKNDIESKDTWYVYILRCEGGSLYTGITTDPARRMREHLGLEPGGARYTRLRRPEALVAIWTTGSRSSASKLEFAIKKMGREDKVSLIESPECVGNVVAGGSFSTLSAREREGFWPL